MDNNREYEEVGDDMEKILEVNGRDFHLKRKKIRHMYLVIDKKTRQIKISAPYNMEDDEIVQILLEKEEWIGEKLNRLKDKIIIPKISVINGGSLFYFGDEVKIKINYVDKNPLYGELNGSILNLYIKRDSSVEKKKELVREWYRDQLMKKIKTYIEKWEGIMDVDVYEYRTKQMKTRWGTCNPSKRRIWINLELAKLEEKYLEYIIVHEMLHLFERGHGDRFKGLMTKYYPDWEITSDELNRYIIES